jgi:polyisoprenoid-binding protein YceI
VQVPIEQAATQSEAVPTEEEEAAPAPEEEATEPMGGALIFQIVPEETEARFVINEVLNGSPKTVVGATNAVSGQVSADYADTSSAQATIRVDLSTLVTDNSFRNRAVRDVILETGQPDFQFATFETTSVSGLPGSVTVGETYPVQITGNLTIHGVTREVTFDGTITPVSETRLEGSASLTLAYADFGVAILRLPPQVASVEDVTTLEIDFVAIAS